MFKDAIRAVSLVAVALDGADVDVDTMRTRAGENWISVTELADTLARERGLPFKAGHTIAARLVRSRQERPDVPLSTIVADISREVTGTAIEYTEAALVELLSPEHFVAIRRTHGGPAPETTGAAIEDSRSRLAEDVGWIASARVRLLGAESGLKAATVGMG